MKKLYAFLALLVAVVTAPPIAEASAYFKYNGKSGWDNGQNGSYEQIEFTSVGDNKYKIVLRGDNAISGYNNSRIYFSIWNGDKNCTVYQDGNTKAAVPVDGSSWYQGWDNNGKNQGNFWMNEKTLSNVTIWFNSSNNQVKITSNSYVIHGDLGSGSWDYDVTLADDDSDGIYTGTISPSKTGDFGLRVSSDGSQVQWLANSGTAYKFDGVTNKTTTLSEASTNPKFNGSTDATYNVSFNSSNLQLTIEKQSSDPVLTSVDVKRGGTYYNLYNGSTASGHAFTSISSTDQFVVRATYTQGATTTYKYFVPSTTPAVADTQYTGTEQDSETGSAFSINDQITKATFNATVTDGELRSIYLTSVTIADAAITEIKLFKKDVGAVGDAFTQIANGDYMWHGTVETANNNSTSNWYYIYTKDANGNEKTWAIANETWWWTNNNTYSKSGDTENNYMTVVNRSSNEEYKFLFSVTSSPYIYVRLSEDGKSVVGMYYTKTDYYTPSFSFSALADANVSNAGLSKDVTVTAANTSDWWWSLDGGTTRNYETGASATVTLTASKTGGESQSFTVSAGVRGQAATSSQTYTLTYHAPAMAITYYNGSNDTALTTAEPMTVDNTWGYIKLQPSNVADWWYQIGDAAKVDMSGTALTDKIHVGNQNASSSQSVVVKWGVGDEQLGTFNATYQLRCTGIQSYKGATATAMTLSDGSYTITYDELAGNETFRFTAEYNNGSTTHLSTEGVAPLTVGDNSLVASAEAKAIPENIYKVKFTLSLTDDSHGTLNVNALETVAQSYTASTTDAVDAEGRHAVYTENQRGARVYYKPVRRGATPAPMRVAAAMLTPGVYDLEVGTEDEALFKLAKSSYTMAVTEAAGVPSVLTVTDPDAAVQTAIEAETDEASGKDFWLIGNKWGNWDQGSAKTDANKFGYDDYFKCYVKTVTIPGDAEFKIFNGKWSDEGGTGWGANSTSDHQPLVYGANTLNTKAAAQNLTGTTINNDENDEVTLYFFPTSSKLYVTREPLRNIVDYSVKRDGSVIATKNLGEEVALEGVTGDQVYSIEARYDLGAPATFTYGSTVSYDLTDKALTYGGTGFSFGANVCSATVTVKSGMLMDVTVVNESLDESRSGVVPSGSGYVIQRVTQRGTTYYKVTGSIADPIAAGEYTSFAVATDEADARFNMADGFRADVTWSGLTPTKLKIIDGSKKIKSIELRTAYSGESSKGFFTKQADGSFKWSGTVQTYADATGTSNSWVARLYLQTVDDNNVTKKWVVNPSAASESANRDTNQYIGKLVEDTEYDLSVKPDGNNDYFALNDATVTITVTLDPDDLTQAAKISYEVERHYYFNGYIEGDIKFGTDIGQWGIALTDYELKKGGDGKYRLSGFTLFNGKKSTNNGDHKTGNRFCIYGSTENKQFCDGSNWFVAKSDETGETLELTMPEISDGKATYFDFSTVSGTSWTLVWDASTHKLTFERESSLLPEEVKYRQLKVYPRVVYYNRDADDPWSYWTDDEPVVYITGDVLNDNRLVPDWEMTKGTDGKYHLNGVALRGYNNRGDNGVTATNNVTANVIFKNRATATTYTKTVASTLLESGDGQMGRKFDITLDLSDSVDPAERLTVTPAADYKMPPFIGIVGFVLKQQDAGDMPNKNNYSLHNTDDGWQESWILYDRDGYPVRDLAGNYIYSTMWPPKNNIFFQGSYKEGTEDKYFELNSENLTFKYDQVRASNTTKVDGNYADGTWQQVCTGKSEYETDGALQLLLKDGEKYARYVAKDVWLVGALKLWTGWGSQTRFYGDNPGAQWDNHRSWGTGKEGGNEDGTEVSAGKTVNMDDSGNLKFPTPTYYKSVEFYLPVDEYGIPKASSTDAKLYTIPARGQAKLQIRLDPDATDRNKIEYNLSFSSANPFTVESAKIYRYDAASYDADDESTWSQVGTALDVTDYLVAEGALEGDHTAGTCTTGWVKDQGTTDVDDYLNNGRYFYVLRYDVTIGPNTYNDEYVISNPVTIANYNTYTPNVSALQLLELTEAGKAKAVAMGAPAATKYLTYRAKGTGNYYYVTVTNTTTDANPKLERVEATQDAYDLIADPDNFLWTAKYYAVGFIATDYKNTMDKNKANGTLTSYERPSVYLALVTKDKYDAKDYSGVKIDDNLTTRSDNLVYGRIVDKEGLLDDVYFLAVMDYKYTPTGSDPVSVTDHQGRGMAHPCVAQPYVKYDPTKANPYRDNYFYTYGAQPPKDMTFGPLNEDGHPEPCAATGHYKWLKLQVPTSLSESDIKSDMRVLHDDGTFTTDFNPMQDVYIDATAVNPRVLKANLNFVRPNVSPKILENYDVQYDLELTTSAGLTVMSGLYHDKNQVFNEGKYYRITLNNSHPSQKVYPILGVKSAKFVPNEKAPAGTAELVANYGYNPETVDEGYIFKYDAYNQTERTELKVEKVMLSYASNLASGATPTSSTTYDWMYLGRYGYDKNNSDILNDKDNKITGDEQAQIEVMPAFFHLEFLTDVNYEEYAHYNKLMNLATDSGEQMMYPHLEFPGADPTNPAHKFAFVWADTGQSKPVNRDDLSGTYVVRGMHSYNSTAGEEYLPQIYMTPVYIFDHSHQAGIEGAGDEWVSELEPLTRPSSAPRRGAPMRTSTPGAGGDNPTGTYGSSETIGDGEPVLDLTGTDDYATVTGGFKKFDKIGKADAGTTGIENVIVGADFDAEPEYYNLHGVRVLAPAAGQVYLVRRGNVVTKELLR